MKGWYQGVTGYKVEGYKGFQGVTGTRDYYRLVGFPEKPGHCRVIGALQDTRLYRELQGILKGTNKMRWVPKHTRALWVLEGTWGLLSLTREFKGLGSKVQGYEEL